MAASDDPFVPILPVVTQQKATVVKFVKFGAYQYSRAQVQTFLPLLVNDAV